MYLIDLLLLLYVNKILVRDTIDLSFRETLLLLL